MGNCCKSIIALNLAFMSVQNLSHEGRAVRHCVSPSPTDIYLGTEEKENTEDMIVSKLAVVLTIGICVLKYRYREFHDQKLQ